MFNELVKKLPKSKSISTPKISKLNFNLVIDFTPEERLDYYALLNELSKTKKIKKLLKMYGKLPAKEIASEEVKEIKEINEQIKEKVIEDISKISYVSSHETPSISIPPVLLTNPKEMVAQLMSMKEKKKSPIEIKKEMIEYTKRLFKEKDPTIREQIRKKIKELKNLLSLPKKTSEENIFDLLFKNQNAEIENIKKHLLDEYYDKLYSSISSYLSSLNAAKTNEDKVKLFNIFKKDLENIRDSFVSIVKKYTDLLKEAHTEEMEELKKKIKLTPALRLKLENRKKEILNYERKFEDLIDYVSNELNAIILCREEQVINKNKSEEIQRLFEILTMPEEEVINEIHNINENLYNSYINNKISKGKFLWEAKKFIAEYEGIENLSFFEKVKK